MSERFDDIIRGKLAAARHDGTPDWDALRSSLDGEAFDEVLSRGLGTAPSVNAPAMAGAGAALPDWDSLSAKLEADGAASGEAFDALISRRVADATTELEPTASWRQLSHRIDTLWPLRRRLARYRVLEIAAAALFLLTFGPPLRDHLRDPGGAGSDGAVAVGAGAGQLGTERALNSDADAVLPRTSAPGADAAAPMATPMEVADETAYSPLDNLLGALGLRDPEPPVRSAEEIAALYGATVFGPGDGNRSSGFSAAAADGVNLSRSTTATTYPSQRRHVGADVGDNPEARAGAGTSLLSGGSAAPLALRSLVAVLSEGAAAPTVALPAPPAADNRWSFGASAGRTDWLILTPTDVTFDRASSSQCVGATQLGAHVLYDLHPRWRFGLSLAIASARYETGLPEVRRRAVVTRVGYDVIEDFRGIDLDVARATAEVRFGLLPGAGRLQVWAKAGIGTNAFLRTAYDLHREEVSAPPVTAMPNLNGMEEFKQPIERPIVPTEGKAFTKGLFQGGALSATTQAFGRVGLEAEYQLDRRLRAFGAVDYDVALPGQLGFGPNLDQFGAAGLTIGARISL